MCWSLSRLWMKLSESTGRETALYSWFFFIFTHLHLMFIKCSVFVCWGNHSPCINCNADDRRDRFCVRCIRNRWSVRIFVGFDVLWRMCEYHTPLVCHISGYCVWRDRRLKYIWIYKIDFFLWAVFSFNFTQVCCYYCSVITSNVILSHNMLERKVAC